MIQPKMGEEYLLDLSCEKFVEAFYIGKNRVETHWYQNPVGPEGHTFARIGEDGKIEFYHTRSLDKKLLLWWNSDGDDGPSWPAGFRVSRVKVDPSDAQRGYLEGRLNKLTRVKKVA